MPNTKIKRSVRLEQELTTAENAVKELLAKAENDGERNLTPDEVTTYDERIAEITTLKTEIERAKFAEKIESDEAARSTPDTPNPGGSPAIVKTLGDNWADKAESYSLARALGMSHREKSLDGLEAEMDQEAIRQTKEYQIERPSRGFGIPEELCLMDFRNKRNLERAKLTRKLKARYAQRADMTVGTPADGGITIHEEYPEYIPVLRPDPVLEAMGATVFTGLSGNQNYKEGLSTLSGSWLPEGGTSPNDNQTFQNTQVVPKRCSLSTSVSGQLLVQSPIVSEIQIRDEINTGVTLSIDTAGLFGSGVGDVPLGLGNHPNINVLAGDGLGVNGGAITWDAVVAQETAIETANAKVDQMGYLMTPGVKGALKTTPHSANNANYIWPQNASELNGYRAMASNQMPSNGTKGSGTNLHSMIFGNWRNLYMLGWGGAHMIIDPYTGKKIDEVEITLNTYWNFFVKYQKSFHKIIDIDTTA